MGTVQKIPFPYLVDHVSLQQTDAPHSVVFFGTDYYNLSEESDQKLFAEQTDKMLCYIRKHFPEHILLYQPHPNETDEYTHLNLDGFIVGEKAIAELFLFDHVKEIAYTFSACSGASISAYSMGFESAIFLDLLNGALPDDAIVGYRSYFNGLPNSSFIKSFNDALPRRSSISHGAEKSALESIIREVDGREKIWVIASDPALALRAALILREIKRRNPHQKTALLMISHRRWNLIEKYQHLFKSFDEMVQLPGKRVWYSGHPSKIFQAWKTARFFRSLPIGEHDCLMSFAYLLFEENCLISYSKAKKILFIENRWYHFIYDEAGMALPNEGYRTTFGIHFFNYALEPLLGLYRTIFREYKDGKVINFFRYKKALDQIYNTTFVIMPETSDSKTQYVNK